MGIPAFYCIRNGVSNKSTNIPSSRCLICFLWFFFFIISFVIIASGLFWFRGIWSLFLSGKHTHSNGRSQQTTSISVSNSGFSFIYHTTNGWIRGGYLECIYNWAGIRYRRLVFFWPFSFRHLSFGSQQEKDEHAAMHDARPSPRQKLLDSRYPRNFLSLFVSFLRHRGFLGRYPYPPYKEHDWIARIQPKHKLTQQTLASFLSLALFPNYDDDNFLMTTFSTNR